MVDKGKSLIGQDILFSIEQTDNFGWWHLSCTASESEATCSLHNSKAQDQIQTVSLVL